MHCSDSMSTQTKELRQQARKKNMVSIGRYLKLEFRQKNFIPEGINLFAWSLDVLADIFGLMMLAMNVHLCISAGLTSTAYLIGLWF